MLLTDILTGILAITYVFMLWLSLASYRVSREHRVMASAVIFVLLLIKDVSILFLSFEGVTLQIWHFAVDIIGLTVVLILWKWRR